MRDFEKEFEGIYLTLIGELAEGLPWVLEAAGDGACYDQAWQEIDDARAHLCQRFQMDWEDPDLERLVNAVIKLQRNVAWRMYCLKKAVIPSEVHRGCRRSGVQASNRPKGGT